jgi:hypothetical protein
MNTYSARPLCLLRAVRREVPPSSATVLAGGYALPALSRLFRDQAGRRPLGSGFPPARAGLIAKEAPLPQSAWSAPKRNLVPARCSGSTAEAAL